MKKLFSTIIMLAVMVAALSLTACGGSGDDDEEGYGGGNNNNSSLSTFTMVSSNGKEYVVERHKVSALGNCMGNLSDREGTIWCHLEGKEEHTPGGYFCIVLESVKTISDFPVGLDLGKRNMHFTKGGYSYENKYSYSSGSIVVIANDGKSFTLSFNNYVATRSSGTMTINGTLYVENEKTY